MAKNTIDIVSIVAIPGGRRPPNVGRRIGGRGSTPGRKHPAKPAVL
jgi:hypothetical protein